MQKEADMVEREKANRMVALQKEAANAEKERLRQEAAVKKQADNAEKERLRAEAAAEKERLRAEKEEQKRSKTVGLTGTIGGGTVAAATATGGEASRPATTTEPIQVTGLEGAEGETVHDQVTTTQTNEDDPFVDSIEQVEPERDGTLVAPVTTESSVVTATPITDSSVVTATPITASKDEVDTPASPPKSESKVKSWFKTRFRSGSKTQKDESDTSGFVGGAALTGTTVPEETEEPARSDSERNVALAGRSITNESEDMYGGAEPTPAAVVAPEATPTARSRSPSISSLSSSDYGEPSREAIPEGSVASDPPRGRRGFKERFLNKIHSKEPTPATTENEPAATQVDSGGEEDFEEAKDTFTEEKLAPAPTLHDRVTEEGPGPAMKAVSPTEGSRERSRFTEEL